MIPEFRAVPPSPAQLAADVGAPHTVFLSADRDLLALATSAAGIGVDLNGDPAKVVASAAELDRLSSVLETMDGSLAGRIRRYLHPVSSWKLRTRELALDRPTIMGILNLTSDSFSGDGVGADLGAAVARAAALRAAAAEIIDVGAESARADRPVLEEGAETELVGRAVRALVAEGHLVSCDSYKPAVARAALEAGAEIINDISGMTLGSATAAEALRAGAGYVLNYSYSVPKQRPESPPKYDDVVSETVAWMERRADELLALGFAREAVAIDPGIAFGKSHGEDIAVLQRLGELRSAGLPILLAHSRKHFIGSIGGRAPAERDLETHVLSALAFAQGARIFRVHDPAGASRALRAAAALAGQPLTEFTPDAASWPWRAGASAAHMSGATSDKAPPPGQRW
ncbi:MAG: dihydropteroate synthase [Tepidiformaceae bacterium]